MDFWHLCGRGVERRDIVLDDQDRLRFIHNLFAFNDRNFTPNYILGARHDTDRKREKLVDIHAFCLMLNHYHLLVSELIENGISIFMHKFNMGYTKYFNEKYERSGVLWQGKYRRTLVQRDAHFLYIPFYIHLNPLDYTYPQWRDGTVTDVRSALDTLALYRWSSHLDYFGTRNFPSLIRKDILNSSFGSRSEYQKTIADIISDPSLAEAAEIIES